MWRSFLPGTFHTAALRACGVAAASAINCGQAEAAGKREAADTQAAPLAKRPATLAISNAALAFRGPAPLAERSTNASASERFTPYYGSFSSLAGHAGSSSVLGADLPRTRARTRAGVGLDTQQRLAAALEYSSDSDYDEEDWRGEGSDDEGSDDGRAARAVPRAAPGAMTMVI